MVDTLDLPRSVRVLVDATLRTPGTAASRLREVVAEHAAVHAGLRERASEPLPEGLERYVEKVARFAYKTTDEDVAGLQAAGYSEDQIFEVTLSAALGASLSRFERGLELLREPAREPDPQR